MTNLLNKGELVDVGDLWTGEGSEGQPYDSGAMKALVMAWKCRLLNCVLNLISKQWSSLNFYTITLSWYQWFETTTALFIGRESDHWECLSLTHRLTHWLPLSKLDLCDPGVWRCLLKTCWGCYCCWYKWWGSCMQQFVTDLEAEFGHKAELLFKLWAQGLVKILKLKFRWNISWSLISILLLMFGWGCTRSWIFLISWS